MQIKLQRTVSIAIAKFLKTWHPGESRAHDLQFLATHINIVNKGTNHTSALCHIYVTYLDPIGIRARVFTTADVRLPHRFSKNPNVFLNIFASFVGFWCKENSSLKVVLWSSLS
jgi:hypothetical protein